MKLMKMGSVARAAGAFIVTLMIVLTVIACEGPAGPAGEAGDPGKDAPVPVVPANTAPVAASATLAAVTLDVGKSITVNVAANFSDPEKDTLEFGALPLDATVATAAATASMVKVTGVAKGDTIVAVTATDPGGLTATAAIPVTVVAPKAPFDPKTNKGPVAVGTIKPQTINVASRITMDVADYFTDENVGAGDVLTYTVESNLERVASATVAGSVVTVNAVAEGSATVTVTATDLGKMAAMQAFKVTSQAVPEPTKPAPSCGTTGIAVTKKCEVTIGADEHLNSTNTQKVTVNRKGTSTTIWEVVAVAKGTTDVEVLSATGTVLSSFAVKVNNQAPTLKKAANVRPDFLNIEEYDTKDASTGKDRLVYLVNKTELNPDTYIEDKDGDTLTWDFTSSTPNVIVIGYQDDGAGGKKDGLLLDITDRLLQFDITFTGTDNDVEKAESPPMTVTVAAHDPGILPRMWNYDIEQRDDDGALRAETIGMRRGVDHTLTFMRPNTATDRTGNHILEFAHDWMEGFITDSGSLEDSDVDATLINPDTTIPETPVDGDSSYIRITPTGPIILSTDREAPHPEPHDLYLMGEADKGPVVEFSLTGGVGTATITLDLMVFYDADDKTAHTPPGANGPLEVAWHRVAGRTLTLNIERVTK